MTEMGAELINGFEALCERNSYHALQVCSRYRFDPRFPDRVPTATLDRLLESAPNDPVILSMKMESAEARGDHSEAKRISKGILESFPDFMNFPNDAISPYQKIKKEKILAHFPFGRWMEISAK
jgi:hypothetical protein